MYIEKIKGTGFRNYKELNIVFEKGINVLYGLNGSGKTNVVEAIDYLAVGKSFRADSDLELINFNEKYTKVEIEYFKKKKNEIKIIISKEGKKISKNDIELKKLSELPGNLIDVVFTPQDVLLFKDSPSNRRRLIDIIIASIDKRYLQELSTYKKLLKDRNAILKEELFDEQYLQILTDKMIDSQFYIFNKRNQLFNDINKIVNSIHTKIDEEINEIKIKYLPFVNETKMDEYKEKALEKYLKSKEADIKRKTTNEGIHLEDFKMYLNGHEIDLYGSQGQNRIACLSLKLSLYEIIKKEIKEDPILILDDVLSELDINHQKKLIKYLEKVEQTFITCTEIDDNLQKYATYEVVDSTVIRR